MLQWDFALKPTLSLSEPTQLWLSFFSFYIYFHSFLHCECAYLCVCVCTRMPFIFCSTVLLDFINCMCCVHFKAAEKRWNANFGFFIHCCECTNWSEIDDNLNILMFYTFVFYRFQYILIVRWYCLGGYSFLVRSLSHMFLICRKIPLLTSPHLSRFVHFNLRLFTWIRLQRHFDHWSQLQLLHLSQARNRENSLCIVAIVGAAADVIIIMMMCCYYSKFAASAGDYYCVRTIYWKDDSTIIRQVWFYTCIDLVQGNMHVIKLIHVCVYELQIMNGTTSMATCIINLSIASQRHANLILKML